MTVNHQFFRWLSPYMTVNHQFFRWWSPYRTVNHQFFSKSPVLPVVEHLHDSKSTGLQRTTERPTAYDLTVVTLYIPLGTFLKGFGKTYRTKDNYRTWMHTWAWLTNKVVAFFADSDDMEYFRKLRSAQPADRTVLIKVERSQLNAFKDYDKIRDIYSRPKYPKYQPNTVNANYSCTMNAKFDALQMTMDLGHVSTEFMAWLDIGALRNMLKLNRKNETFSLEVPQAFNDSRIGFAEVAPHSRLVNASPWDYIQKNHIWVSGSCLIGSKKVVQKFITSYKKTVQALLASNMSSTDEQVYGAMYSPQFRKDQKVGIAVYTCKDGDYGLHGSDALWFCLPYVAKEAAELRSKN
ncbi:unnamed protein product [Lymnaea stagnalis]|uniref:Uncharacterized protein n=1 Tax=Lymnaea stagnalis TaxID=6523 RepID=A0AAV2HJR3_LYMST